MGQSALRRLQSGSSQFERAIDGAQDGIEGSRNNVRIHSRAEYRFRFAELYLDKCHGGSGGAFADGLLLVIDDAKVKAELLVHSSHKGIDGAISISGNLVFRAAIIDRCRDRNSARAGALGMLNAG